MLSVNTFYPVRFDRAGYFLSHCGAARREFFENSSPIFQGFGEIISPTSGKGCGTFLKSGYPLALLAIMQKFKTGVICKQGIFRNGYPLALLAKLVNG